MIPNLVQELFTSIGDKFNHLFNTEFWSLVGYTGIAAASAIAIAYFFPALRSFAGAVFFSLAALWYGFHKGQKSRGD